MSTQAGDDRAISVGEAAQLTGASSKSLRRRIERGTLGSIRQGARRLVPISELVRVGLLDDARGGASTAPLGDRTDPWQGARARPASPPALRSPWSPGRPGADPGPSAASPSGISEKDSRRLAAMVDLVKHQTRTVNELKARVERLEALVGRGTGGA